jgi:hypothetical protein
VIIDVSLSLVITDALVLPILIPHGLLDEHGYPKVSVLTLHGRRLIWRLGWVGWLERRRKRKKKEEEEEKKEASLEEMKKEEKKQKKR